jgi:hypothetical protein
MSRPRLITLTITIVCLAIAVLAVQSDARPPIRKAFFTVYPSAVGTRLDDLPSNSGHCGVCHFDFNGGGPRNPYGLAVQVAIGTYGDYQTAIQSVQNDDPDADGYSSLIEITDTVNFTNTPTFPGLTSSNLASVSNVTISEIQDYLTPSGSLDTTPPDVTVLSPNGAESYDAGTLPNVTWTATDASGIAHVDIYMSDDNGSTYRPVAKGEANDSVYEWFVPNRPGTQTLIRVLARDNAGNYGWDDSDSPFTIVARPAGYVPTTLRDIDLPGTQPLEGAVLDDVEVTCVSCHGNYNTDVEPWYHWRGSMMGNAARDPLFRACMAVAEQEAPSAGDICIRCHSPGGWQEGRSVDTSGGMLTAKDRESVQCDFCHRLVDPIYKPGTSPTEDQAVLDSLDVIPLTTANGQFINDPTPVKRGPYADAVASHQFLYSPFHRAGDLCGTCHDVSNPVFESAGSPGDYEPTAFDAPHPDGDLRDMFPIERTFSEWSVSDYASAGVYAPQFAGSKADGIVGKCQDCHQRDTTGKGCNQQGAPNRTDLPLHDLMGGNYFVPDILPTFYPTEVDVGQLDSAKLRAITMLELAASMELTPGQVGNNPSIDVKITNESGHKLPSGYPEGRRIWIDVKAYDVNSNLIYESGAYDPDTGVLTHDDDLKVYEIHAGLSPGLASALGLDAGTSFHFVLNDTVYYDNRIPPRGCTNAELEAVQSPPVDYSYGDNEYWDTTTYVLPTIADFVDVTLYYQSTSKEYIEFLRDQNVTNSAGQDLYDAWVAQGRAAPIVMVNDNAFVTPTTAVIGGPGLHYALLQPVPNPFRDVTKITYSIAQPEYVSLKVFDVAGRQVRTLVDEYVSMPGPRDVRWDGRSDRGEQLPTGVYFYRIQAGQFKAIRKTILAR